MYLGIEIGGTKLQLGLGLGDGQIVKLWRGKVDALAGGEGIRQQILAGVPELLASAGLEKSALRGIGVGFGGPTDDATQSVIKSHHITGWDNFPLAAWLTELLDLPTTICNDADVAGLAEATFGAGKGLSPIFYITVGTGVGGGLIINGEIYRGVGKGAAEIGHLSVGVGGEVVEHYSSGNGIAAITREHFAVWSRQETDYPLYRLAGGNTERITSFMVFQAAEQGDVLALGVLREARRSLADAILAAIVFLCPRRVVIGGGVSLMGEELFFKPLRDYVAENVFPPFAGLTDIVPAALGEEVVVHGALALARKAFGG